MPSDWQKKCISTFDNPQKVEAARNQFGNYFHYDFKANSFYATKQLSDGNHLSKELIETYTLNASVLNAVISLHSRRKSYVKALGGILTSFWDQIAVDVEAFRSEQPHTLKTASLRKLVAKYKKDGYECLISGKLGNANTAKVKTEDHLAFIEELIAAHRNLDNEAIARLYNIAAKRIGWKQISASIVARHKKESDLYTYAGRRGETNFRNSRLMQNKRSAPNVPLVYLTVDGWDVELFYQRTETDRDGYSRTTYHNRLTVVVVLDPFLKYPVGYAIGSHETPELIKEAFRNATEHTVELFGARYRSHQLQSDHYGRGKLIPMYEGLTTHYTPARVKNSKSKVIENEFRQYNRKAQLYYPNWSGHGVTGDKENQPNGDMLNSLRHSFPDESGCLKQIQFIIEEIRSEVRSEYVQRWHEMPEEDHLILTDEDYLFLFGEHSGYTNKLYGHGICPTIGGIERAYDSFDIRLRENRHQDWLIKYDPNNLDKVLAVNAKSRNGRLLEEIGTIRIMLEAKHIQPMALYDRKDGDSAALAKVAAFNKEVEGAVIDRRRKNRQIVDEILQQNTALDGTLTKIILTDSRGQHKNNKNAGRQLKAPRIIEIKQVISNQPEPVPYTSDREAYIAQKVNVNEFLNL